MTINNATKCMYASMDYEARQFAVKRLIRLINTEWIQGDALLTPQIMENTMKLEDIQNTSTGQKFWYTLPVLPDQRIIVDINKNGRPCNAYIAD